MNQSYEVPLRWMIAIILVAFIIGAMVALFPVLVDGVRRAPTWIGMSWAFPRPSSHVTHVNPVRRRYGR